LFASLTFSDTGEEFWTGDFKKSKSMPRLWEANERNLDTGQDLLVGAMHFDYVDSDYDLAILHHLGSDGKPKTFAGTCRDKN